MKRRITMTLLGTATLVATVLPQAALARTELASRESSTVEVSRRDGSAKTLMLGEVQDGRGPFGGPDDLADCPEGHHLVPFDMPIYDEDGLFVVGYETVWFCIPDDLEPAG